MKRSIILTLMLLSASSISVSADAELPFWSAGDWFQVNQVFTAEGLAEEVEFGFSLDIASCRWNVDAVATENIPSCGVSYEVYNIGFSNCGVSGTGTIDIGLGDIPIELRNGVVNGHMYCRTEDISPVLFLISAQGELWGNLGGGFVEIGTLTMNDVQMEFCPYMQDFVWPLYAGATWDMNFTMYITGDVTAETTLGDFSFPLDESQSFSFSGGCTGMETVNGCESYKIVMNSNQGPGQLVHYYCPEDILWYALKTISDLYFEGDGDDYFDLQELTWNVTDAYHASQPTPTPTSTPTDCTVAVDLDISQDTFYPGDLFLLTAYISNEGPDTYDDQPFAVVLDVYGTYFFYPGWTGMFDYTLIDLGIETRELEILNFTWPQEPSSGSGIIFYGAVLTNDFLNILGEFDMVVFGWNYP